jgi:hypothetical protein
MKLLKPMNLLLYFLSVLNFFFIGILYAVLTDAAKGQGLAGGAIVLGYGVMGSVIGLMIAVILAYYFEEKHIIIFNKILSIIFALFIFITAFRFFTREEKEEYISPKRQVAPIASAANLNQDQLQHNKMGLGMAAPNFFENKVLYFYGNPNLDKPISDHTPTDSVVFVQTEIGFHIAEAPPWFVPAHLKMDYEILILRIKSMQYDFAEVVVNENNGQTSYIDRNKCRIKFFPEFILSVNTLMPINPNDNLIRIKPLSHAEPISTEYDFLRPIRITQEWVYVELLDNNFKPNGRGWIRWNKDGVLLVTYSLLS